MHDKGNFPCMSEDWLLANLPEGWTYDCVMGLYANDQSGFVIFPRDHGNIIDEANILFIPLDLLKLDRTANC